MSTIRKSDNVIDIRVLKGADEVAKTWSARLPKDAVAALAKEAVHRLAARATSGHEFTETEVRTMADALLFEPPQVAADLIQAAQNRGARIKSIYLGLLAPAAQVMGEYWETDDASFAQVTLGTSRIFVIIRTLRFVLEGVRPVVDQHAILAVVPGETHSLGVTMARDLLERDGWDIELFSGLSHDELIERLDAVDSNLIGLSAGHSNAVPALARLIVAIRVIKPHAMILVSGPLVSIEPDISDLVGADAAVENLEDAAATLKSMFLELSERGIAGE